MMFLLQIPEPEKLIVLVLELISLSSNGTSSVPMRLSSQISIGTTERGKSHSAGFRGGKKLLLYVIQRIFGDQDFTVLEILQCKYFANIKNDRKVQIKMFY